MTVSEESKAHFIVFASPSNFEINDLYDILIYLEITFYFTYIISFFTYILFNIKASGITLH